MWMESRSRQKLRKTCIIKFYDESKSNFAEVQYYFHLRFGDIVHTLAVISVFSPPDPILLEKSSSTVYACSYLGTRSLKVIDVCQIKSVVAMIPDFEVTAAGVIQMPTDKYFLVEKLGLDITVLLGEKEEDEGPDNDEGGTFIN
ncbi:hypothetical protein C0992_003433 [Termitomyces sp. T32_za158]|nr:hypothetical protein C0992_003433 [Termitomyces sp. T32_za158]